MWAMGRRVQPGWNGLCGSLGQAGAVLHRGPQGQLSAEPGPHAGLTMEVPSDTGSDLLRPYSHLIRRWAVLDMGKGRGTWLFPRIGSFFKILFYFGCASLLHLGFL